MRRVVWLRFTNVLSSFSWGVGECCRLEAIVTGADLWYLIDPRRPPLYILVLQYSLLAKASTVAWCSFFHWCMEGIWQ